MPALRRSLQYTGAVLIGGAAFLSSACTIQPWVKPYERDRLADPIMSWDRDAISSAYVDHIQESREGSRGASGSAGGGCGCN
jgi:hypothetical protein